MNEENILRKLGEHEVRLRNIETSMVTKDDLAVLRNDILDSNDQQMKILLRLDQERLVTNKRIDDVVNDNQEIKKVLKIV